MSSSSMKKLDTTSYHVAWICAVADLELIPALLMLDEFHDRPDIDNKYDDNTYKFGTMAGHNVVVAACPDGMTGQVNVGHIAGPLFRTFTAIRMTLLVGIGGGIPQKHLFSKPLKDVRLGDVVVGWPSYADGKPAVIYYDAGRAMVNGFQTTTQLNRPHMVLLKALPFLRTDHTLGKSNFHTYLDRLQHHNELGDQFKHPGLEHDLLFKSNYEHVGGYNSYCVKCDKENLVERKPRAESQKDKYVFHQGRIATGNSVVQDGKKRDSITAQHGDVFCIDMETAGVDINSSCLVIRGISDYADSHKSDLWRSYAAGKAVVFARELLDKIPPADIKEKMVSVIRNKHWLVNRSTSLHFTGRREIIDRIVKKLTSEDVAYGQRRVVLTGMAGQGKSEICLHVANQVRDNFWGIFWVDISTQANAEKGFSEVAEALGCTKTVNEVRNELSSLPPTCKWLLILDNADDPHTTYEMYLPSGDRGAVLITSRDSQCARFEKAEAHEELESLKMEECVQLFFRTLGVFQLASDTKAHASTVFLVEGLKYQTAAILQAASSIASGRFGIADYLHILRENQMLIDYSYDQELVDHGTRWPSFRKSIQFLEQSRRGISEQTRKDSLQLMKVLSTFQNLNVPLHIFSYAREGIAMTWGTLVFPINRYCHVLTGWHVARLPEFIQTREDSMKLRLHEATTWLESLALVKTDQSDSAWKSVSMHPLLRGWAGDPQSQQEKKEALRMAECIVALSICGMIHSEDYGGDYSEFAPLLTSLLESDVDLVDEAARSRCILQVCFYIARAYWRMSKHKEAYELTKRIYHGLGLHNKRFSAKHDQLYALFAAAALREDSHPAEALRILQERVRRAEKPFSGTCPETRCDILFSLGIAYHKNARAKEAVATLRNVVKACQDLGHGLELVGVQYQLATALLQDGQCDEAIALIGNADGFPQMLSCPRALTVCLLTFQVLATAYRRNGQVGEESPLTITTRPCTAQVLQASYLSAFIVLCEFGLTLQRAILGKNDPATLISQQHVARAYLVAERFPQAITMLERLTTTRKSRPEEKHPSRLKSQHGLGQEYVTAICEQVEEASIILEQLFGFESFICDPGHRERLMSQELLDEIYAARDSSSAHSTPLQTPVEGEPNTPAELTEARLSGSLSAIVISVSSFVLVLFWYLCFSRSWNQTIGFEGRI